MSLGGAGTCIQGGPLRPQAGKRCTARPPHPRSPGGVPSVAARQAIACGPRAETGGTERSCGRGGACLEGAGRRHVPVAEDTIVRTCGVGVGVLAGARGSCDPRSCRTRTRALTKAEIELFVLVETGGPRFRFCSWAFVRFVQLYGGFLGQHKFSRAQLDSMTENLRATYSKIRGSGPPS